MHICVHIQYVSKYDKMDVHVELSKPIVSFLVKKVEVLSVPKDEESGHSVPVSDNHHSNFFLYIYLVAVGHLCHKGTLLAQVYGTFFCWVVLLFRYLDFFSLIYQIILAKSGT